MAQQAATLPFVKTNLKRWLEDRAEEAGIAYDELPTKAGMSSNKLTICEKHPEKAHPEEVIGLWISPAFTTPSVC